MKVCKSGDVCVLVGGKPENLGAFVTILQREPNGWLFESASRPLVTQDDICITSSWGSNGECYVIRDEYLHPIPGSEKVAAEAEEISA